MEVNKLESREVLTILFGMPVMVTLIVLASIGVGHWVTTRSDRPTNVTVAAAPPTIEVNVPQQPAPKIQVSATSPNVDVNVPQAAPPTINVTPPPAVVTVLDRSESGPARLVSTETPKADAVKQSAKAPVPAVSDNKSLKPVEKPKASDEAPQFKPDAAPVPAPVPAKADPSKSSDAGSTQQTAALPLSAESVRDEDLTLDTLYQYAEKYIDSYCQKNNLDSQEESAKWSKKWQQGVEQAIRDNTDGDEQSYINRITITKRECFDIEKATPEKIVEGCRIMLRYRDGQFAWLKAMRDAVTNESMKKTLVFLAAGVR